MIRLITHGDRYFGPDPVHTPEGIGQIRALITKILSITVSTIICGTGKRFQEVMKIVIGYYENIPIKFSPLCGSADGLEKDNTVVLTNGTFVAQEDYMGIIGNPAIDIWKFIGSLPDNALLCAGGELMIALGFKTLNQKGHLYEIDSATRSCRIIA